jgi:hypothetical protein
VHGGGGATDDGGADGEGGGREGGREGRGVKSIKPGQSSASGGGVEHHKQLVLCAARCVTAL